MTPLWGHTDGRPLRDRAATTWSLRIWPEKQLQGPASSTFVLTKIRSSELNTHTPHVELYFLFKFGRKGKPQGGKENVLFFSTDLNSKESKECDSLPFKRAKLGVPDFADLEFPLRVDSWARWVEAGCPAEAWSPSAFLGWRSIPQPFSQWRRMGSRLLACHPQRRRTRNGTPPSSQHPSLFHRLSLPVPGVLQLPKPRGIQMTVAHTPAT